VSTSLAWILDGDSIADAAKTHSAEDDANDYADELLDARADLIAETEAGISAASAERIAWSQMQEDGALPANASKVWVAGRNPCPVCEELDGQEVPLDELFQGEEDEYDGPPDPHPGCQCTLALVKPS